MEGKNFPSYHRHLLTLKTAFRQFFGGTGGGMLKTQVCYICTVEHSKNHRHEFESTRQPISEIFIYFYTILGWSVEGVRRGSTWTGP